MSDLLVFWVLQQAWGGPLRKLIAVRIAQTTYAGFSDTGISDLVKFTGASSGEVTQALEELAGCGLVVADPRGRGHGFTLGAVFRDEDIVLRMDKV